MNTQRTPNLITLIIIYENLVFNLKNSNSNFIYPPGNKTRLGRV